MKRFLEVLKIHTAGDPMDRKKLNRQISTKQEIVEGLKAHENNQS